MTMQSTRPGAAQISNRRRSTRLESIYDGVRHLFTANSAMKSDSTTPDEHKAPQLGLQAFPGRLEIPQLESRSQSPLPPPSPTAYDSEPSSPPLTHPALPYSNHEPQLTAPSTPPRSPSDRQYYIGVDPEEQRLTDLARRKRHGRRRTNKASERRRRCFPQAKSQNVKRRLLVCFVSGLFLGLFLTIYLALALSNYIIQQVHIVLILIILATTIVFCHSLVRLCMLALRPATDHRFNIPSRIGPSGFAQPTEPIQVVTAHDEEAIGAETEAIKIPPPAYGLWRCSVRVDPNLLHWQRVERHSVPATVMESRPSTPHRPPSYISDDGVEYVVSAAPRRTTVSMGEVRVPSAHEPHAI